MHCKPLFSLSWQYYMAEVNFIYLGKYWRIKTWDFNAVEVNVFHSANKQFSQNIFLHFMRFRYIHVNNCEFFLNAEHICCTFVFSLGALSIRGNHEASRVSSLIKKYSPWRQVTYFKYKIRARWLHWKWKKNQSFFIKKFKL